MDADAVRGLARADTPSAEYWMHVSDQAELPVAGKTKVEEHLARVEKLIEAVADLEDPASQRAGICKALLDDADLLDEARLLVSLKNKRVYLELSYLFSRTSDPSDPERTLCGCAPHELVAHDLEVLKKIISKPKDERRAERAAGVIADYLLEKGVGNMLAIYAGLDTATRTALMTYLIAPGEMQQREAKRRGHGAEGALADLVGALGCSIRPEDKARNPMGAHDPHVNLETFQIAERDTSSTIALDLLVLDGDDRVRVCVQSLIQSSDPGQFGVDKAKDTEKAKAAVDRFNAGAAEEGAIHLWGLLDGVGYAENKSGTLDPMLGDVHQFVQLKSLYKAALDLHRLGLARLAGVRFDATFYSEETYDAMCAYVPGDVPTDLAAEPPDGGIRAGWAWVVPA